MIYGKNSCLSRFLLRPFFAPFRTGEHIGETLLLGKGMDSRKNLDNFLEDPFESRKVKKLEGQLGSFFESNVNNY